MGREGEGWKIAMLTLAYERGPEDALGRQIRFRQQLERLMHEGITCFNNLLEK
mgnify:CR=1 FL=1